MDITDTFDLKLAALRAHASQTGHLGDGLDKMLREWNGGNAAAAGLPARPARRGVPDRVHPLSRGDPSRVGLRVWHS